MAYKPVGVDENSNFPPRVEAKLAAKFVKRWMANTAYGAGDVVINPTGQTVTANTSFTSGNSYTGSNWTIVPTGILLIEKGATVPAGTPTGTIIFQKG